jgi:hypothetical protein
MIENTPPGGLSNQEKDFAKEKEVWLKKEDIMILKRIH